MSEEIRKRDGVLDEAHVSVQREERRLSTADLAGTSAGNAHVSFQPRVESDVEDHVVAPSANHPDEIVLERSPGKAETTNGVDSVPQPFRRCEGATSGAAIFWNGSQRTSRALGRRAGRICR